MTRSLRCRLLPLSMFAVAGHGVARPQGAEAGGTRQVTPETLFQAGSISRPIAAIAALRLVEQGKLSLDEDVNHFGAGSRDAARVQ